MADIIARQSTPVFIFLYPQAPTVLDAISVTAAVTAPAILGFNAETASIYNQIHTQFLIDSAIPLAMSVLEAEVGIYYVTEIQVPRRSQRSAWQARLGARLDPIKQKFLDNSILLAAHPTDMLRIRVERDSRTQDIRVRKIIANEILPIMLPVLQDVPLRRLIRDDRNVVSFSMTDVANSKPFEAYCPAHGQLHRDDLLFRFIKDPYSELPYVMVLQVKDELGTISYSSLLYIKYSLTFYDEELPSEVVSAVYSAAVKRERLKW